MLIKLCHNCPGTPSYTENLSMTHCPYCGGTLSPASVSADSVNSYRRITAESAGTSSSAGAGSGTGGGAGAGYNPFGGGAASNNTNTSNRRKTNTAGNTSGGTSCDHTATPGFNSRNKATDNDGDCGRTHIRGVVSVYKYNDPNTGYHRYWYEKIIQALVYRQRFGDVMHSFYVTTNDGNGESYNVNVHGPLGMGARLADGLSVEVSGKMHPTNVLMADSVCVVNAGRSTKLRFRRSLKAITTMMVLSLLLILGLAALIMANTEAGMAFLQQVKSFIILYVVIYVLLAVVCTSMFVRRRRRFGFRPRYDGYGSLLLVLLVVAFIITAMIFSAFSGGVAAGIINVI